MSSPNENKIKKMIIKILEGLLTSNIPPDYSDKIRQLQDKNGFNLQTYINSYISGDAVKDNGIDSEDFNAC